MNPRLGSRPLLDRRELDGQGVSELPENQLGVDLAGVDQLLLQIVVDRRLLRAVKAGSHAIGLGTECQRCNEASAIAEPFTRDHWHIQLINSAWQQNQRSDAVPTGMPGSLEIINANSRTVHLQG
jgi:hypothetical protein